MTIAIEAKEKGGTFDAGRKSLASSRPLFVPVYEVMGNEAQYGQKLVDMGAQRFAKSRTTERADLTKIFAKMEEMKGLKRSYQQESLL